MESGSESRQQRKRDRGSRLLGARARRRAIARRSIARTQPITSSSRILVTLAERPYPFPSRTRKSSSPAPKILRGQPFGKIGRRQDLVLSGSFLWLCSRDDDRGRRGCTARRPHAPRVSVPRRGRCRTRHTPRLSLPARRTGRLALGPPVARPPLCGVRAVGTALAGEADAALPHGRAHLVPDLPRVARCPNGSYRFDVGRSRHALGPRPNDDGHRGPGRHARMAARRCAGPAPMARDPGGAPRHGAGDARAVGVRRRPLELAGRNDESGPAQPVPTQLPATTLPQTPVPTVAPSAAPSTAPTTGPTAAPSEEPSAAPDFRIYRVEPGDTLSAIAARFDTTVSAIVNLNDLKSANSLRVGLKTPAGRSGPP